MAATMISVSLESRGFDRLDKALTDGISDVMDRGAEHAAQIVRRKKRDTDARVIPLNSKGKPKWKRTGNLLKGTEITGRGAGNRQIETTGPAAKAIKNYPGGYAEKLKTLPTSKDGIDRANPFDVNAAEIIDGQIKAIIEQGLRNLIR